MDEQIQVVLAVLKGELSLAEAARRHGVSSATVGNWRDRFVDAGKAGMDRSLPGPGRVGFYAWANPQAQFLDLEARRI